MNPVLLTITQGISYPPIIIIIDGDYSTWIPQGQIRPSPQSIEVLAEWEFSGTTYNSTEQKTYFYASLGATETEQIPVPIQAEREASKNNPQWNKVGVTVWVTDIEIKHPTQADTVIQLLPLTYVRIVPGITRG